MRVPGQQRRTGLAMCAIDRPFITGSRRLRKRHGPGRDQAGPSRCSGARIGRQCARLRRPGVPGRRLARRLQGGARHLRPPVAGQIQRHRLAPEQAIGRAPRLRRAEQHELRRGEPAPARDPGIHSGGVGIEDGARVGREPIEILYRPAAQPQHPHRPVERQRGRAYQFGNPAGRGTPGQVHLKHAVARMNKAQHHRRISVGLGVDQGHAIVVERDMHGPV